MTARLPAGFDLDELRQTSQASAGEGLDAGIEPETRFLGGVVRALIARAAHASNTGEDSLSPSAFLFAPAPAPSESAVRRRTLAQGSAQLAGFIWFTNEAAQSATGFPHEYSLDDLMEYVDSSEETRSVPVVFHDPGAASSALVYYRHGVSNEEKREDLDLNAAVSITPAQVNEAIDFYHSEALETPGGVFSSFKLWLDGENWKSIPNPEKTIQSHIRATLMNKAPGVIATEEDMGKSGRCDIAIVTNYGGAKRYIGILELKVLRRDYANAKAISDGVNQAYSYGLDKQSDWTQLCVWDLRNVSPDDDPFEDVRDNATRLNVLLKRWFVFSTLSRYREHLERIAQSA